MAYAFYHPTGDPSNELQLYIFEMADPLKALGKYGSEKPDEFTPVAVGSEGYTTAGSLLFYAGRYYTQIVSTQDDPKFAAFALDLAKRVANRQKPGGRCSSARRQLADATGPIAANAQSSPTRSRHGGPRQTRRLRPRPTDEPGEGESKPAAKPTETSPAAFFALCRRKTGRETPSTLPRMFLATAFFPTSSWPITRPVTRPGRASSDPTAMPRRPRPYWKSTSTASRKTAPKSKNSTVPGADEMVVSNNIGLIDFVFRKGNTLAGANGATSAAPAEAFARTLAKSLPAAVPTLDSAN